MHEIKKINEKMMKEALQGLEKKGYNATDFQVMSQVLDNMLDICKIEHYSEKEKYQNDIAQSHTNDIEGTEIDDNIISMNEHFRKYISYKKKYQHRHDEESMSKIMTELEEFLLCMMKILEEMRTSSDFEKEREMIKGKLREMFSLYQEKSN